MESLILFLTISTTELTVGWTGGFCIVIIVRTPPFVTGAFGLVVTLAYDYFS